MKLSNEDLLVAIRGNEYESVFRTLYKKFLPYVRNYILKNSGTDEDASDIFQDTIVIFFEQVKLGKFEKDYDLGGYIYTISRNLWINKQKKKGIKTEELTDYKQQTEVDEQNILKTLIDEEKQQEIEKLLDQLGEPCKSLLIDSIFNELTPQELSKKYNIESSQAAKARTYRCRKKLGEIIEKSKLKFGQQ